MRDPYAPRTFAQAMREVECEDKYGRLTGRAIARTARMMELHPEMGCQRRRINIKAWVEHSEKLQESFEKDFKKLELLMVEPTKKKKDTMPRTRRPRLGP